MRESLRLGRVAGVELGVNWSFFLVFSLIAIVLATAQFPQQFPDRPSAVYAAAGVSAALLFLGSLLAHELAHALVARRYGLEVEGVTLWLFGGVARLKGDPPDPGADLRISTVGPLVSVALSVVFLALTAISMTVGAPGIAVAVLAWLTAINLLLAVFNLAPAAPLDGGRMVRALVWRRTGDRFRATQLASRAGQVFGFVLVVVGLASFVFLPGLGGLWIALIGGFIVTAATAEGEQSRMRGALHGLRVTDVMTPMPLTVPEELAVTSFLESYVFRTPHSAFPTVDDEQRPTGLVTLNRVKKVAAEERDRVDVRSVACPLDELPVASPSDEVSDLLPRMTGCPDGRALVIEDGRLVGMVSARDVMRHLESPELVAQ
jgi:Zn-dependent protease/CBS domain-containing protein